MRRREIIDKTGIAETTFTTYLRARIIRVLSSSEGGRDYDPISIPRIDITKQLTRLGFNLEQVLTLLNKNKPKEIQDRLGTMPVIQFEKWLNEQLGQPRE
jgi:DNA-binding transcriptional MerR regulator